MYANQTPTSNWCGAMTLPRKLSLRKANGRYQLVNYPLATLEDLTVSKIKSNISLEGGALETRVIDGLNQSEIRFETSARAFRLSLGNSQKEEVILTMSLDDE